MRHGTQALEPRIANMLVFKGQMELDEALAQWKTRTHIQVRPPFSRSLAPSLRLQHGPRRCQRHKMHAHG